MAKIISFLLIGFLCSNAFAIEARDLVYPPPKMVQRSYRVTLAECLDRLGTQETAIAYGCFLPVTPPTPGDQMTYLPPPLGDRPSASYTSGVMTSPSGSRFGARLIVVLTESAFSISFSSISNDPSTGRPYLMRRVDAVNEITRLWNLNRMSDRNWNVMVWVFSR